MDLLFLILAAVLLAVDFLIASAYQKGEGNAPRAVLRFNFFIGLFTAVIFFFINGCKVEFTLFSGLMALAMTSLAILYTLIGFKVLAAGNAAYYSFFLMTGGMTVPYLWGLFFLDETFSWLRLAGLGLILGAALLLYGGKDRLSPKVMALCGVIFLLNGAVSVFSKEHAISTQGVSAAGYVILTALVKVVLCGGILLGSGLKKSEKSGKIKPKALVLTALSALISGLSYLLQLNSAAGLPATVVYPIVTGGSIVFTAVAGWLILKERPTKRFLFGVVICFAGTCLFL